MNRVTHQFVRFYSLVADSWTQPVETLDPHAVPWPANAYAFTLHERVDVIDGLDIFNGKVKQVGPMYYHPDSYVRTRAEVAADPNRGPALLANMDSWMGDRVIYTRWGNWPQPYEADKVQVLIAAQHQP